MIEVRLFATFREGRDKITLLEPTGFKSAGDVLKYFGISKEEVAILLINGRHSSADDGVKDGDVLAIFPPVGGG
jgi:Molybdopterin converting factor, small subunit